MGLGSRREIKIAIARKKVKINGGIAKKSDLNVDPKKDKVFYEYEEVVYRPYLYIMLNKPMGVITAKKDNIHSTVIDVIGESYGKRELSPVGRLDKDTEGFLILTDDGGFNHEIMSPKKHVAKKYYAQVEGLVDDQTIETFAEGMLIDQDERCLPSQLELINREGSVSEIYVTLYQGKYHQVKRMFQAVDMAVIYLKRVQIGGLFLDDSLKEGQHRLMTKEEIDQIRNPRLLSSEVSK
jgi:16S rRNA pseudouridine516 synthase